MSVESTTSASGALGDDEQNEFQNLPTLLSQWKKIQEDKERYIKQKKEISQQIREQDKRSAAMETMIMTTMKRHGLGAIDLKSSGARVLYKKRTSKAPIAKDDLLKHVSEYLKSPEEGRKFVQFLNDKKEVVVKERLFYEKNETQ
jgi:hypothetical protein